MAGMGASVATSSSIQTDFIWLINTVYWKSNAKPDSCKGYSVNYCEDCEHLDFCRGREEILSKLSELRRKRLEEMKVPQEPVPTLQEEPTKV